MSTIEQTPITMHYDEPTSDKNFAVAVYHTHEEAEAAVKSLQHSGFDMKKLSIAGRDYHTDEHVVGYYNTGDRMKAWGKSGAFWGGLLVGFVQQVSALFLSPQLQNAAIFVVFILIVALRPEGLFGRSAERA